MIDLQKDKRKNKNKTKKNNFLNIYGSKSRKNKKRLY